MERNRKRLDTLLLISRLKLEMQVSPAMPKMKVLVIFKDLPANVRMEYLCLQPGLYSFNMYPWILHGTALTCHKISGRFIHVILSIFLPRRFLYKQRVRHEVPDRGVSLYAKVKAQYPLKSPLYIGSLDNVGKIALFALT